MTVDLRTLIGTEKDSILKLLDEDHVDEGKFRYQYNVEMLDVSNKIALAMKENKQSAQMVKLGEKQIEAITEKMDQFKNENMKFKASMKEKFYSMDVSMRV